METTGIWDSRNNRHATVEHETLRPCPFCGGMPRIYDDVDDTTEHGKPDEGGKMNKQNETVLLEHLADTFETKLREADRSIGDDIPNQYREGWMDAFGWAATYCRLLAERESPTTPDASGWSKSAYLRTAPSSTCTTRTANR